MKWSRERKRMREGGVREREREEEEEEEEEMRQIASASNKHLATANPQLRGHCQGAPSFPIGWPNPLVRAGVALRLSTRVPTEGLFEMLNVLYTAFDTLVDKHGVYKVDTIGDGARPRCRGVLLPVAVADRKTVLVAPHVRARATGDRACGRTCGVTKVVSSARGCDSG